MPSDSVIYRIFRQLLNLSQHGHKRWANQINYKFSKFRISTIDLGKFSLDKLKTFESHLHEKRYLHMHDWHHGLSDPDSVCKTINPLWYSVSVSSTGLKCVSVLYFLLCMFFMKMWSVSLTQTVLCHKVSIYLIHLTHLLSQIIGRQVI